LPDGFVLLAPGLAGLCGPHDGCHRNQAVMGRHNVFM
jgi:hypothetical protein